MKLLSTKDIKKRQDFELDQLDRKKKRISNFIATETEKMNQLNIDFDPEKRKKQKEFNEFCYSLQLKKTRLLEQLGELETRKEIAERSLDKVREEIYFKHQENKSLKFKLEQKEKELVEDKKLISGQMQYINKKIEKIARQEKELIENKKLIKNSLDFINSEKKAFTLEKKEFEKLVQKRKEDLEKQRQTVGEEKKANQIIKTALIEQQAQVEKAWIRIRDERQMLERAKAEIYGRSKKRQ